MPATYRVHELGRLGAKYAFALLLQHIREAEEPFVTYGAVARLLEKRLNIPRVFPTHIGEVAGVLMNDIEAVAADAPPINALVTRPNGIPGTGFASFYDRMWRGLGDAPWDELSRKEQLDVIAQIRASVRNYVGWDEIYLRLFGDAPPRIAKELTFTEKDGKPPETARPVGAGESEQHRLLKEWALGHPEALGLASTMKGTAEAGLLSGDRIDVLFREGSYFVAVEVKSILSSEDDWRRGIYQCVKYRAVLEAQDYPVDVRVDALLLTERPMTPELRERADALGVKLRVHALNQPFRPLSCDAA